MTTSEIIDKASAAKFEVAACSDEKKKNKALAFMADCLLKHTDEIIKANDRDVANATGKITPVMIDRLRLTKERIAAMASSILDVVKLPDPVGRILSETRRPNGLVITKVSVPLGVIAMIYESRPNVTSDAAALAIKSGNACVLRGGKEAINSNIAIADALKEGIDAAGITADAVGLVTDTSRDSANESYDRSRKN